MNTADVMVVVKVLANFQIQIQIVLDLQGYMEYGKQINFDLDVKMFKHRISYFNRI